MMKINFVNSSISDLHSHINFLRIRGSIPPLPNTSSWRGTVFYILHGTKLVPRRLTLFGTKR